MTRVWLEGLMAALFKIFIFSFVGELNPFFKRQNYGCSYYTTHTAIDNRHSISHNLFEATKRRINKLNFPSHIFSLFLQFIYPHVSGCEFFLRCRYCIVYLCMPRQLAMKYIDFSLCRITFFLTHSLTQSGWKIIFLLKIKICTCIFDFYFISFIHTHILFMHLGEKWENEEREKANLCQNMEIWLIYHFNMNPLRLNSNSQFTWIIECFFVYGLYFSCSRDNLHNLLW